MPTVLITGANRGIGLALARSYAADGWRVLGTCRDPASAGELGSLRGDVSVERLEIRDDSAIAGLAEKLSGEQIDVLFNNAGVAGREVASLGRIDSDVWMDTFRINTVAPIKMAEAFRDHVAHGGRGKMAFVSSVLGSLERNVGGGRYAYGSTKAALNMACRSLAGDLRGRGIAVVCLHPGHVRPDMGGAAAPVDPDESAAGMRKVVDGLTLSNSGSFINYDGSPIPW